MKQRAFGVLKTVENIEVMAVLDDQQLGVETGGAPNFVIVAALPDELVGLGAADRDGDFRRHRRDEANQGSGGYLFGINSGRYS